MINSVSYLSLFIIIILGDVSQNNAQMKFCRSKKLYNTGL